jgi:hypothetical protein
MTKMLFERDTFVRNAAYVGGKLQRGDSGFIIFKNNVLQHHPSSPPGRPGRHKHERSADMTKKLFIGMLAVVFIVIFSLPAAAQRPVFGKLYYDGDMVRTVIPPASMPFQGRDNLYPIMGGVQGQLAVAAVAPGNPDYHGGQWAVHLVEWDTEIEPSLLTSEADVLDAALAGDVTITRLPGNDFKCPIQP